MKEKEGRQLHKDRQLGRARISSVGRAWSCSRRARAQVAEQSQALCSGDEEMSKDKMCDVMLVVVPHSHWQRAQIINWSAHLLLGSGPATGKEGWWAMPGQFQRGSTKYDLRGASTTESQRWAQSGLMMTTCSAR